MVLGLTLAGCRPSGGDGGTLVFLGDSITEAGEWAAWFPGHRVVNAGVSGNTSADVLARFPELRPLAPARIYLMVGINDIARGEAPPAIAERILRIRAALEADGSRVVLQSTIECQPGVCGPGSVVAVRDLNTRLRAATPADGWIDLRPALSDAEGLRAPFTVDGVHLNAEGYRRWLSVLRPRVGD